MTGDMVRRLLQQQFQVGGVPCNGGTVTSGARVVADLIDVQVRVGPGRGNVCRQDRPVWINGVPVQPTDSFRVTMNNFSQPAGDGFTVVQGGDEPARRRCRPRRVRRLPSSRRSRPASRSRR
jgi:hypothetical protein